MLHSSLLFVVSFYFLVSLCTFYLKDILFIKTFTLNYNPKSQNLCISGLKLLIINLTNSLQNIYTQHSIAISNSGLLRLRLKSQLLATILERITFVFTFIMLCDFFFAMFTSFTIAFSYSIYQIYSLWQTSQKK